MAQTAPTGHGVTPGDGFALGAGDSHGTPTGQGVADGSPRLWSGQPLATAKPGRQLGVGETAIVAKGLTAGDKVVSEGQNQLRPGARVQPRPAGGGRQP